MLASFADGALFGRSTGSAPPRVLALHGWARSHRDFDAVLAPAGPAAPLDAIALDLPGFGATPAPPQAWGSVEYAEEVVKVLAQMAGSVVVLGHSFGGKVAVQLAARHPDAVAALVLTGVPNLVAGPGGPAGSPPAYRLVRRLRRAGLVSEGRLERARQRHGSSDYRAAEGVMRQVLVRSVAEHYEEELDRISCPVTLVWGDDDTAAPLRTAEQAAARLDRAELVVAPGAGHLTPLTVPGILRQALEEQLS